MSKSVYLFFLFVCGLSLILTMNQSAAAQRRKKPAAKKAVVEKLSDAERAATLENLQGAKAFQILAELNLGLANAYIEDRTAGELSAKVALTKLDIEMLRHPESLLTIFVRARGYATWNEYLLNRHGFGKDAAIDKTIKEYVEAIRQSVDKGLTINPTSPFIIAVRGSLRDYDCRIGLYSTEKDCYQQPLADFSRAVAALPDEVDFFSLRAEFFERKGKTLLAEQDNQTAKSLTNALELKLELDEQATARKPFHSERAGADTLYFMKILSLLQDENVRAQLNDNAATLKSFREQLMKYYALADAGYAKAIQSKPSAENLERRGMLRLHLGIFAADLGVDQPAEYARKNYEEALGFYNEAIKLNAKFAAAFENRARIYRKLGKKDLAEEDEKQFDLLKLK